LAGTRPDLTAGGVAEKTQIHMAEDYRPDGLPQGNLKKTWKKRPGPGRQGSSRHMKNREIQPMFFSWQEEGPISTRRRETPDGEGKEWSSNRKRTFGAPPDAAKTGVMRSPSWKGWPTNALTGWGNLTARRPGRENERSRISESRNGGLAARQRKAFKRKPPQICRRWAIMRAGGGQAVERGKRN